MCVYLLPFIHVYTPSLFKHFIEIFSVWIALFFVMEISFVSSALSFENREIPSSANCAAFNLGSQHDCGEEKVVNVTQRRRRRDRVKWHLIHVEKILAFDFHSSFTLSSYDNDIRRRMWKANVTSSAHHCWLFMISQLSFMG